MSEKARRRILVVDDEITVCKSIRQAILSDDYEVDMALSGEEALKKDRASVYDLIITDLMMPGISGLDLLKSVKEQRPSASVIMITGYPTIKTAVQSVKLGAFDYIPKPFTPNDLRGVVTRAFKMAGGEAAAEPEGAPQRVPSGYYYMLGHTWLKVEADDRGTVGVVHDFLRIVGIITQLELPKVNDTVTQGNLCGRIIDASEITHRIWSPASGQVIEVNAALAADTSLLRRDPYGRGFLFRIQTTNLEEDLKGLLLAK
jgi:ActR/RegA family two-component response regulator/glycine cleavage system H lipoate-binding protein